MPGDESTSKVNTGTAQGQQGAADAAAATETAKTGADTGAAAEAAKAQAAEATAKEETSLLGGEEDSSTETQTEEGKDKGTEKKEEGKKDDEVIPEKYEFKVPDGMAIDPAALEIATPVLKELGMSQAKAQKLADVMANIRKEETIKSEMALLTQRKAWREDVKKNPEWKKDTASVKKLINELGDDTLKTLFSPTSWLGDHPGMIRFLAKLAKERGDDAIREGSKGGQQELSQAERIYGKQ